MIRKLATMLMVICALLHVVEAQGLRGSSEFRKDARMVVPAWRGSLRGSLAIVSGASTATGAIWRGLRGAVLKKPVLPPCAQCVRSSEFPSMVPKAKIETRPMSHQGPSILPSSAMPTAGSGKRVKGTKGVKVPPSKVATPELAFKKDDGFRHEEL